MICCAPGCGHKSGNGCHFYNFPSPNDGPDWEKWYKIWVLRINRVNKNGELWCPETPNTKLCSCHFHPEQQWDPKSRKGGLKCKEPVFFEYNRDLLSSGSSDENAQVLSSGSSSAVEVSVTNLLKNLPSLTKISSKVKPTNKHLSYWAPCCPHQHPPLKKGYKFYNFHQKTSMDIYNPCTITYVIDITISCLGSVNFK